MFWSIWSFKIEVLEIVQILAKADNLVQSALFILHCVSLTNYSISERLRAGKTQELYFFLIWGEISSSQNSLMDKVRLDDGNFLCQSFHRNQIKRNLVLHKWVIVSLTAKHTWFDVQIFWIDSSLPRKLPE